MRQDHDALAALGRAMSDGAEANRLAVARGITSSGARNFSRYAWRTGLQGRRLVRETQFDPTAGAPRMLRIAGSSPNLRSVLAALSSVFPPPDTAACCGRS